MSSPYFSIMLPIKGRAGLARDALASLLQQDFTDFEVLVSNNGADPGVKSVLGQLLTDSRVRYVEQLKTLDMPTHWETVSQLAVGQHFMVLPDRSVLRRGALKKIRQAHGEFSGAGEIVTWPWDLYFEEANLLVEHGTDSSSTVTLQSDEAMLASISGASEYPYALPRGLNSSVAINVLSEMRETFGAAFGPLTPDFTFAYQCLLLRKQFLYLGESLMISQGLGSSNGGLALRGDARPYFLSLGVEALFQHTPVKAVLVENGITEDFLRSITLAGRQDMIGCWERTNYYVRCFNEISEKRRARLVPASYVATLQAEVEAALLIEPDATRLSVHEARRGSSPIMTIRQFVRHMLPDSLIEILRPHILRLRGARPYKSVLHAAGFAQRS